MRKKNIDEQARERDQLGRVGGGKPLDAEYRQRQQRVAAAPLVDDERGEQRERAGELGDRARRAPALIGRLDEGEDQQQHPGRGENGSAEVEVSQPGAVLLGVDQPEDPAEHEQRGQRVDEHHPAPAWTLGEQAAEQHAGGGGQSTHGAPDAERRVRSEPSLKVVVRIDSAAGSIIAAPSALRQAGADQDARAAGETADQRGDAEQHGAGDEDPPAAEQVGGAAAEQHEAAVGEQVGARDPLQALHGEAQVAADRGKRDVDDRGVDEVEERDGGEQGQGQLAAAGREEGRLEGVCGHLGEPPALSR